MIRRIRIVLRFQAKPVAMFVDVTLFSGDRAVQEIAGIELHAGLGGEDFHNPSAGRLVDLGERLFTFDTPTGLMKDTGLKGAWPVKSA